MTDQTAIIDAPDATEFSVASTGRELVPVPMEISLDQRAASINRHLDSIARAEDHAESLRYSAGRELIEAREHVAPGEWLAWCKANIKRSFRDVQRLMKIAGADDPDAALEQDRAKAREGMKTTRAKATNVSRIEDDRASGEFRPLGPRIRNTISVPEKLDGETRLQKAKRLFLHFASEDIDVCNKIMRDLPFDPVDDIGELRSATHAVIEAWEKIDAALAMRAGLRMGARARARHSRAAARVEQAKLAVDAEPSPKAETQAESELDRSRPWLTPLPDDLVTEPTPEVIGTSAAATTKERLKLLRDRAERNGYRVIRRGSDYRLVDKDGCGIGGLPSLDSVEREFDAWEGKIARQFYTPCGTRLEGMNNSEAWLAAHPGKTMEDFERASPAPDAEQPEPLAA